MSQPPDLLADLARDPSLYPQKLDLARQALLIIRFSQAGYRAASFLDDRILTPQITGGWAPLAQIAEALSPPRVGAPLHFIFHAGHVGSTLASRLLDEIPGVLPLREPLPLRTLAEAHDTLGRAECLLSETQFRSLSEMLIGLWRRGYPETQAAILKATSSAGRIAPRLLDSAPDARALYLNLAAEPYLATLLSGENNPLDLRGHGPERMRRLTAALGEAPGQLHAFSLGELAAMTWLTERLAEATFVEAHGARVLRMDFETLLAAPGEAMARVAAHFGIEAGGDYAARVEASAALTRYSKATEHAYSPGLRAALLAETRTLFSDEIKKGLAWLDQIGRRHAKVAALLG